MQTTIVKWGNSQGIRIPKAFLQSIQLAENDPVDVILENGKIVIQKNVKGHKTTKERLAEFYGEQWEQIGKTRERASRDEIDWGEPAGQEMQEIW